MDDAVSDDDKGASDGEEDEGMEIIARVCLATNP